MVLGSVFVCLLIAVVLYDSCDSHRLAWCCLFRTNDDEPDDSSNDKRPTQQDPAQVKRQIEWLLQSVVLRETTYTVRPSDLVVPLEEEEHDSPSSNSSSSSTNQTTKDHDDDDNDEIHPTRNTSRWNLEQGQESSIPLAEKEEDATATPPQPVCTVVETTESSTPSHPKDDLETNTSTTSLLRLPLPTSSPPPQPVFIQENKATCNQRGRTLPPCDSAATCSPESSSITPTNVNEDKTRTSRCVPNLCAICLNSFAVGEQVSWSPFFSSSCSLSVEKLDPCARKSRTTGQRQATPRTTSTIKGGCSHVFHTSCLVE